MAKRGAVDNAIYRQRERSKRSSKKTALVVTVMKNKRIAKRIVLLHH
jgi:hypothetical protein